jgi:hypothetical protein
MNSVLAGIKELLGIPEAATEFDNQLVMYINMALMSLHDIGFMPTVAVYQITLAEGDLDEYLPADPSIHHTIMVYLNAKVRLLFDPPAREVHCRTGVALIELRARIKEVV